MTPNATIAEDVVSIFAQRKDDINYVYTTCHPDDRLVFLTRNKRTDDLVSFKKVI